MKKRPFFLKHYKVIFLLGTISMLAVCCKTTRPVAVVKSPTTIATPSSTSVISSLAPAGSDVAIAAAHWPGTTLDNLNQGYSIFDDKCTDCHRTKRPQDFTADEWKVIMHKMGRKAKLDSNQYNLVLHYILTKREAILGAGN
ncbi:MAG TPA: hypothetical protein VK808_09655 [Bacteroidia bacterium]|jgi:hypothetical protein|nr:hypothetical protein [Bacteroidia bacterium]